MFSQYASTLHTLFPGVDPLDNLLVFVYEKYLKEMTKVSKAIVRKPELVELAIQNTLIHIGRYPQIQMNLLERLTESQERARSYIYTIVRGRCILILNSEKNKDYVCYDELCDTLCDDISPEEIAINLESCIEIDSYFEGSTDINIEVLRLHREGLAHREIAQELNVTEENVRKRLSRGRAKFHSWHQKQKILI